jgi:membrane dipeptidase
MNNTDYRLMSAQNESNLFKDLNSIFNERASMSMTPMPILDGHNDTLLDLHLPGRGKGRSFFERSDQGHIDLPRAREGGLAGGFFAIFTPSNSKRPEAVSGGPPAPTGATADFDVPLAPPVDQAYAQQFTLAMAARLFRLEAEAGGAVKVARTADELTACLRDGVLAMIFHIEGAEAIDPGLDALEVLYQAGLRSLGITWSRANAFGAGVPFKFPQSPDIGPGLTDAGCALVKACNRLGILLDLSHLNEKGFWDVAKLSDAPLVATHSNAHALSSAARNLTDKQLDAIGETGGVVGVNFHVGFLREDGRGEVETPLGEIVRHIDYIARRIGIDHVVLGSDFDGATMPRELGDAAGLPRLVAALRVHGYGEADIRKIAHENWLRVLRQTWQ